MFDNTAHFKLKFLKDGGEMGALIRQKDWKKNVLGPIETWPQSLLITLGIVLNSRFPMFLWWGPQLTCFYNDAYRPSLGNLGKHPEILGMPAKEAWTEIWDIIYPLIKQVLDGGDSTWSENQLIPIFRNGKIEDVYWTFSYSRVNDDAGNIGGVLVTCTETTESVLNKIELEKHKDQLLMAIDTADMATWDYDPASGKFDSNQRFKDWFDLTGTDEQTAGAVMESIADKDRDRITTAIEACMDFTTGGNFEEEFSIRNPTTNEEKILKAKGKVSFDESHNPLRFTGTLSNATNEILAGRKIAESERNLRLMILNAPVSIAIMRGKDYVVEIINEKALALWRRTKDAVLGKPVLEVMPELIPQGIKTLLDDVYNTGDHFQANELAVQIESNGMLEMVYVNFTYEPLFDTDGKVNGIMAVGIEVTDQVLARKKIEDSEARVRSMVESAPFPMGVYAGKEMRIIMANQAIMDAWGKGNDVIGKLYSEILPELENQQIFQQLEKVYTTGQSFSAKNTKIDLVVNGKITPYYFNYNFTPLYDGEGKVYGVMNTASDVTDLNIAKIRLEESEMRFRNTVLKAPIGIAIFSGPDFMVDMANETYLGLVAREESTFIGKPLFKSLPELEDVVYPLLHNVYETGVPYYGIEFPVTINKYGEDQRAYFNFVYQPLKDDNAATTGIIVVATEVTGSVVARHRLEESEKQFRNLVMQSPIPMTIFRGKDFVIELANAVMFEKIWRRKKEDVEGRKLLDVFPELVEQKFPALLREVMETGEMHAETEAPVFVNGDDGLKKFYLDFEYAPIYETEGTVSGIVVTINDVTEKVAARLKVEEAETRLRIAAEATELATWDLDLHTRKVIYTPRLAEIFGHGTTTDISYDVMRNQVYAEDLKNNVEVAFEKAIQTGIYSYEARLLRPDKTTRWIRTQGRVFFDDGHKPSKLVGTIRDITEEKLHQQELLESEQKFRLLADSMPQHIWTADPAGNLNYFNRSVYDFSGLSPEEMAAGGWLQIVHPDDRQLNIDKWTEAVRKGSDFILEHRFRRSDGEYRWQLSRAIPQKAANGNIQMWVGTSTDIQDQKVFTNELEKQVNERTRELEQKNKELEKMNTELQSFAYVSSHDLQEPLRKIQTFANRILEREKENLTESGKDYFMRMQKATKRMQTLIDDLLAYSRTSTGERKFEYVKLNELLDQVLLELKEDIQIRQAVIEVDELSRVNVIPFQFRQLMHNLIGNSLKFSRSDVTPHVKISHQIINGKSAKLPELSAGKKYYCLSVTDNGIGFEEQYQDRIFEVFQRLHGKDEYKGTGIGLAIVKKIVENHNGIIKATGSLNKGARFDIYLPLS